jgi:ribonuclease VapC
MIIDSSALVAILAGEPERDRFFQAIMETSVRRLSAASFLETSIVVSRLMGHSGAVLLKEFLSEA